MKPSDKLSVLTRTNHIPLICIFELTRRCNLRCRHCYIDQTADPRGELTTDRIKAVLGQLAKAGTLNLIFTGGEIFLRDDLFELCRFARHREFDLRLFSNGTMIDGEAARRLAKMRVSSVEISLYGRRDTHDRITGVKGSFLKTTAAIEHLKSHGVPVTIKCPVIKTNFKDYPWLAAFAKSNKLNLRLDPAIAPKDSGDRKNLRYRLSGPQMSVLFNDPALKLKKLPDQENADLSCSAGANMVTIGYDGTVYPCLQLLLPLGSVRERAFSTVWNDNNIHLAKLRGLSINDLPECFKCNLSAVCRRCPGIALLEDRTAIGPSKIACKIAKIQHSIASDFQ